MKPLSCNVERSALRWCGAIARTDTKRTSIYYLKKGAEAPQVFG